MKQIRITTPLQKTERGPVHDFEQAVLSEHKYVSLSALYWFGQTAVRFFVRQGKTGANFYRPCKHGFSQTRISTNGVRTHIGFVESLTP